MKDQQGVSRREFVAGIAATGVAASIGYAIARGRPAIPRDAAAADLSASSALPAATGPLDEYDALAKLANNENPYGPSQSVLDAMNTAFKYSMRYGYPDGDIQGMIAEHHGVEPENILLGAGSGEILEVVGLTYLQSGKKVVGVEPSYSAVYSHATNIKADTILLPLKADYSQDIEGMIHAARTNYRDVGFVYLCNPNNPTGKIVSKRDVRALLDGLPEDVPVLIDEAYHHYVEDSSYATAVPYVKEGRPVVVARTFSKIFGLAGMRLGYAVAPAEMIRTMRVYSTGTINASVKWGGVAALQDKAGEELSRKRTVDLRKRTVADLTRLGYSVIPSETNFFMVQINTEVVPVIQEFRSRGVLVGRPFPPMTDHLRVSIGTPEEMDRFMVAFKEIMPGKKATA